MQKFTDYYKKISLAGLVFLIVILAIVGKKSFFFNKKIQLNGVVFNAEMAETQTAMEKGLGGRDKLCSNCAMLFVFAQSGRQAFWMKNMRFPLDIIWIKEGKIVWLEKNIAANDGNVYLPPVMADKVIEINAGLADKFGFQEGDRVSF